MPLFGSWVELHAALTHFPIALLLAALFFDAGALVLRRPAWRETGLAILALAVVSLPIALLSGYLARRDMGRPPVGFDLHWQAAVLTSVVAALLLLWRIRTRSRTERVPQMAMMAVGLASAIAVGYTGHMGGAMIFGGRSTPDQELALAQEASSSSSAIPSAGEAGAADKIAVAAGRMSNALDRMGTATDRLAQKAASQPLKPLAPGARPDAHDAATQQAPAIRTAPLDNAAQKLERVAARFEASAAKMEASVRSLQTPPEARSPSASAASGTRSALNSTGKAAPSSTPATPSVMPAQAPPATTEPPPSPSVPSPDLRLVAGRKLFLDTEIGCTGCHKLSGEGGRSGPDLTFAGRLHPDIAWQIAHLKAPKSKTPGSTMPAYADLPAADIEALAAFLVSLR